MLPGIEAQRRITKLCQRLKPSQAAFLVAAEAGEEDHEPATIIRSWRHTQQGDDLQRVSMFACH
jgi:hypothetical protein